MPAQQFRTGVPEESFDLCVHFFDFSVAVGDNNSVWREFKQGAQPLFASSQSLFGLFATGNVIIDFQNRYRIACGIALQNPPARNNNALPVLCGMNNLTLPIAGAAEGIFNICDRLGKFGL